MNKEIIEKLDYELENIFMRFAVDTKLLKELQKHVAHRDRQLLELVRGEIVKPFTDEEYYSYEYAIVKIISVIDEIKEAINGKG